MRVLIIEDSARLRDLLGETLRDAGYSVDMAATAQEFRDVLHAVTYDLIIVDLGLPDADGLDLIREVRTAGNAVPVLVITARATISDKVSGLDSGADDYLIKPFNNDELLARVRALLRRPQGILGPVLTFGRLSVRVPSGEVLCDEQLLPLRASERRLLLMLIKQGRTVLKKECIEETLSELGREVTPNAIEVLVSRVRKVLGEVNSGVSIETVRGLGYSLKEQA